MIFVFCLREKQPTKQTSKHCFFLLLSWCLVAVGSWLNPLDMQENPNNQYFIVMQPGQSVFITFTTY